MLFNSFTFLIFFAVVLVVHNLGCISWNLKKTNLLVASYIFYAAWNPPFVLLLWLTTIVDWNVAQAIVRSDSQRRKRLLVMLSLAVNLGLLFYFKYGGFVLDSFVAALHLVGVQYAPARPDIVLPIGISFYTFVTLSYTIDVYRGEIPPSRSFVDFALLVTFFPHLVAGPILRAIDFLPQCEQPRRGSAPQLGWGSTLLILGLFEKVVLADGLLAPVTDQVYNAAGTAGCGAAWIGTLAFASQIFFDFDGYSLCAIGVALCLGFVFPDNFRFPYASLWFSDFWTRWHISLSSWLRDYLYISLGGNRQGSGRTYANLMLTMLIGGLWHGASWLFVIWGGLHGCYLVVERLLRSALTPPGRAPAGAPYRQHPLLLAGGTGVTFFFVCLTWIFFRARNLPDSLHLLRAMLTGARGELHLHPFDVVMVLGLTGALLGCHWWLRDASLEQAAASMPWWLRSLVLAILLLGVVLAPGDNRAFIYFQF